MAYLSQYEFKRLIVLPPFNWFKSHQNCWRLVEKYTNCVTGFHIYFSNHKLNFSVKNLFELNWVSYQSQHSKILCESSL